MLENEISTFDYCYFIKGYRYGSKKCTCQVTVFGTSLELQLQGKLKKLKLKCEADQSVKNHCRYF